MESHEQESKQRLISFSTAMTGMLMTAFCGAVAWNLLFAQKLPANRPGATAVQVTVADGDIEDLHQTRTPSSIEGLVRATARKPARSELVAKIQAELEKTGLMNSGIDGLMGPSTRTAIISYQKKHGLKPDGKASQALLDHILFTAKILSANDITGSIPTPPQEPGEPADTMVFQVQKRLLQFGYTPGKADGRMGPGTRKAIRLFERDRNLPETGRITAKLRRELGI